MKNLRTHGKSTIVWLLLGMMVLGLGGYGVTSFSGGSAAIGSVGSADITADDYARSLRADLTALSQQSGQAVNMAQAQAMGVPQGVQARLFAGAALEDQANRIGLSVGDARVAKVIAEAPAFQGPTGQFDRTAYAETLRRQGLSEAEFEQDVRTDESRLILQAAVASGVAMPAAMIDNTTGWLLETRDFTWRELTADQLPNPVAEPTEEALAAWHQANAPRFTAPETRAITYAWLTPDMLAAEVELDETALRDLYESRKSEFQQPERRLVERLVYPSMDEAQAARDRLDAGQADFAALAAERGLTLEDADLGEMTQAQIGGAAGEAIFALSGPGVVGPIQTDLGPALYSMNAILSPVDIGFDEALPELRDEAAADRARRMIEDRSGEFEDLLASGATVEDMAKESPMQLGQIDWSAEEQPEHGSVAGYPAFREAAANLAEGDFPQLIALDDGGVVTMRLDGITPPALKPLDEVRDQVADDWRAAETHRQLLALAEEQRLKAVAENVPAGPVAQSDPPPPAEVLTTTGMTGHETGMARDGWVENLPPEVITQAFALTETGEPDIVDADGRVFLVTLDAIHQADPATEQAQPVRDATAARLNQSLRDDLFRYYVGALQSQAGIKLNKQIIDAVNAQIQ